MSRVAWFLRRKPLADIFPFSSKKKKEKARVSRVEWFDEVEEWLLIQVHLIELKQGVALTKPMS